VAERTYQIVAEEGVERFLSCWPEHTKAGERCQILVQTTHQTVRLGSDFLDSKPFGDSITLWDCALKSNDPGQDDKYRQALMDILPTIEAKIQEVKDGGA